MIHRLTRPQSRRGVAAVEFAFLAIPIFILLTGIWEVGRLVETQQMLTNAAREGARQAATGQLTTAQAKTVVTQYLTVAGLPTANVNVNVVNLTRGGDVVNAQYLDQIQITVTIPVADVRWSALGFITPASNNVSAQVQWITMVDQAFPTPPEPPVG